MTPIKSQWQSHQVATAFLKGVRGAIPGADMQLAVMAKIVQVWSAAPTRLLDLGCGDGILGRYLLNIFPAAHAVFVDFSEPMLQAARAKLAGTPQAAVIQADFSSPQWLDAIAAYPPFDVIVSGFSIHHQPHAVKKRLYTEIYNLLSPAGIFLNLEHVSSATPAGEQVFDEFFIDRLYDFHIQTDSTATRTATADTYYHRPDKVENILAPLDEQCRWLREIGFQDVDCFFKVFELALFGGRKAPAASEK